MTNPSSGKISDLAQAPVTLDNCRKDFPALLQDVNGQPLVYLDSAASAQQPACVIDAVAGYQRHDHANVH
ncbi:MAG TPA: aminotransferase class V-fold PLP-dependent enzyme, partial [Woeseiaceae bacterium]|nr:aminotransferase class V-fold PLP-dependent enzyme [Woeseiaceae bacterium]